MAKNNAINANTVTPIGADIGGSGVSSPTIHGVLVAQGASPYATKILGDGQLLIGSAGVDPVVGSISAGAGISVTLGSGSVTIANTGGAPDTFSNVTATTQQTVVNQGYITSAASLLTYTLPATALYGAWVEILGFATNGWIIAQNSGQQINYGNLVTSTGVTGTLASSQSKDCVKLRCMTNTGSVWTVVSSQGNLDVV